MRRTARIWKGLAFLVVPREWRATVSRDLADEGERLNKGDWWIGAQAVAAGLSLRKTISGDAWWTDVRYALRSLSQARWFTVGAVLTFALGIGVNVAVFSAVDRMLFRTLPYERPQDLVVMGEYGAGASQSYTTLPMTYVAAARQLDAVTDLSLSGYSKDFTLAPEPGDDDVLALSETSYNALSLLGVRPFIGRDFTEEDARDRNRVALLGYETWQRRFGGRADILGERVWSARVATEVIGILPPNFINATNVADPNSDGLFLDFTLFVPQGATERAVPPTVRLKPGVSLAVAQAQVDALVARLRETEPPTPPGRLPSTIRLAPLDRVMFGAYASYLWLVVAASALVFLVACANLSSLMLVRGRSREQQHAVRLALGASRGRLIRGVLVEALCLAAAGGVCAAVTLWLGSRALLPILPPLFSRYAADLSDLRVIAALTLCAAAAALIAGLAPGLRAGRVDVLATLQQHGTRGGSRRVAGRSLLLVEAAVSVVLVMAAAATSRSLLGLLTIDFGFNPNGLYSVRVLLPPEKDVAANFNQYSQMATVLGSIPSLRGVASTNALPYYSSVPEPLGVGYKRGVRFRVDAGLLETIGARVLAGRVITRADVVSHARVGVLNVSALGDIWPGVTLQQAVGRMLDTPGEAPLQIVGVIADMRLSPASVPQEKLFVPLDATKFRFLFCVTRSTNGRQPSVVEIRSRLKAAGLNPTAVDVSDVTRDLAQNRRDDRFRAVLFSVFGLASLMLAVIGLYAVASFEVALRRSELGVRLALGATPSGLSRLVIHESVRPVLIGVALGLLTTFWAGQYLQSFLVRVDARDPWSMAAVVAVLIFTSVVAAWLPARRAARTDPATVLRAD